MRDDKKAIAAMIVSKAAKKPEDDNPFPEMEGEGDSEEAEVGLDAACDDMMNAVQSNDPALFKEALKSFITQYKD